MFCYAASPSQARNWILSEKQGQPDDHGALAGRGATAWADTAGQGQEASTTSACSRE